MMLRHWRFKLGKINIRSTLKWLRNPRNATLVFLIIVIIFSGWAWFSQKRHKGGGSNGQFSLASTAFKDNQMLPVQFTCDGDNINPEFSIGNVPIKAKSLAITLEDQNLDKSKYKDDPFQAHWMVWNIPTKTTKITQGIRPPGTIGRNLFGNFAYGGPCPPTSQTHHYLFTLYALDIENLNKTSDNGLAEVKSAIEKHDIARSKLEVKYTRGAKK